MEKRDTLRWLKLKERGGASLAQHSSNALPLLPSSVHESLADGSSSLLLPPFAQHWMKDASFGEIFGKLSPPLLQSHPFAAEHAPLHKCTPPPPLFQEKFSFAKIKEGGLSHRVDIRRKRWHLTKESPLLSSLEFRHKIYLTTFKESVPFSQREKGLMYHTFCIFFLNFLP